MGLVFFVKVVIFGVVLRVDRERLLVVGSPFWMAPELLRGEFYDHRCDLFSFGIILCEMIGRVEADPDILQRREDFGVDFYALYHQCPDCPESLFELAYNCTKVGRSHGILKLVSMLLLAS